MADYLWKEYDLEVDDTSPIKLATFSNFRPVFESTPVMNENLFSCEQKKHKIYLITTSHFKPIYQVYFSSSPGSFLKSLCDVLFC